MSGGPSDRTDLRPRSARAGGRIPGNAGSAQGQQALQYELGCSAWLVAGRPFRFDRTPASRNHRSASGSDAVRSLGGWGQVSDPRSRVRHRTTRPNDGPRGVIQAQLTTARAPGRPPTHDIGGAAIDDADADRARRREVLPAAVDHFDCACWAPSPVEGWVGRRCLIPRAVASRPDGPRSRGASSGRQRRRAARRPGRRCWGRGQNRRPRRARRGRTR